MNKRFCFVPYCAAVALLFVAAAAHGQISLPAPGYINTVAGDGIYGNSGSNCSQETDSIGDGCPATQATLNLPNGTAVDSHGNIYISDYNNYVVRMVAASTSYGYTAGEIYTVYGTGTFGSGGIVVPVGVAVDSSGNLYIADYYFGVLKVTFNSGVGTVTTFAGTGTAGSSGDGGPATAAELSYLSGVAVDSHNNVYIVDSGNGRIRMVAASTGNGYTAGDIYTMAGGGSGCAGETDSIGDGCPAADGNFYPASVAVDTLGNLYIADSRKQAVRVVAASTGNGRTAGHIYTVPGLTLSNLTGVAVDAANNLYVSDPAYLAIYMVAASTGNGYTAGSVYTVAGGNGGVARFSGDGGLAVNAGLAQPEGMALDTSGNLYFADTANYRIRAVGKPSAPLSGPSIAVSCSPNPAAPTVTVTCTATVSGGATGTIDWTDNGNQLTTSTLSGGTASESGTWNSGTYTIKAAYSGNGTYGPASASTTLTITGGTNSPTLSQWAAIAMGLILAGISFFGMLRLGRSTAA